MPLPAPFDRLRLPVIGSLLFIISTPDLVIAQCKAGIIGSLINDPLARKAIEKGADGHAILAAQAMGADFAYIGSPRIAPRPCRCSARRANVSTMTTKRARSWP